MKPIDATIKVFDEATPSFEALRYMIREFRCWMMHMYEAEAQIG